MQVISQSFLMTTYKRFPLQVEKGKGSYIWDQEGNEYLDFTSGIATCNLGHVPDAVKAAVNEQLDKLWHCSNLYHIKSQEKLAEILVENSVFDEVFFCNSGAEANEAAIKLARIYAKGKGIHSEIITFTKSFHGRTLATLTASGQEKIQTGFAPLMPGFSYLPFNDMEALEILKEKKPCAVLLELVQGEGGVIPAETEWVQKLATICQDNHILLMIDEVQTGCGRTGELFAYQHYGIQPDVITLAKGLGSGFPIGAVLAKKEVACFFQPGTHGSTFGGNPLATTAGVATMEQLTQTPVLTSSRKQMNRLFEELQLIQKQYAFIQDVRGLGFLLGIEIAGEGQASKIVELARQEKLLILTAGPNVVRILPPLIITDSDIDKFLQRFILALNKYDNTLPIEAE